MELKSLIQEKNKVILAQYGHVANVSLVLALAVLAFPGQVYSSIAFDQNFGFSLKVIFMFVFSIVLGAALLLFSYRLRTADFLKKKLNLRVYPAL